jgi:hypothetical protein
MAMMEPRIAELPTPSLTLIRGTTLGAVDFTEFYRFQMQRMRVQRDGSFAPIDRADWTNRTMEQQFDAILYVGPPSSITYSHLSPDLCADSDYMKMRTERFALAGFTAGIDQLKRFCASAGR